MSTLDLVDHFFRHEYGRLVATLTRSVGSQHIEDVEDAVQFALMTAFERWTTTGLPENPPAWLFRVAQNNLLETLRRGAILDGFEPPTWLAGSHLWAAVLSDLHRRCGSRTIRRASRRD